MPGARPQREGEEGRPVSKSEYTVRNAKTAIINIRNGRIIFIRNVMGEV